MTTAVQTQEDPGTSPNNPGASNTETILKETDMHKTTDHITISTRVIHLGTGEHGTVTGISTDDLGTLATVRWADRDALELPTTLHTKHLAVDSGHITDFSDEQIVTECHRRGLPGTVAELAEEARRQGIRPSELLERLQGAYDFEERGVHTVDTLGGAEDEESYSIEEVARMLTAEGLL